MFRSTILHLALLVAVLACDRGSTPAPEPAETATESAAAASAAPVPYSLTLDAASIDAFPGLHSFAVAGDARRTVLLAGRTNGLHGFAPSREAPQFPSFPTEYQNDVVYLLDLETPSLLGRAKVDALPIGYANQLRASNTQYYRDGDWLYVVGGYGQDPRTGTLVTLGYVTAIDYPALVDALENGDRLDTAFAAAHMARFEHPALAITGGDLQPLDGKLLLIYGHQFDGEYTPGGGQAFQRYSNSVRAFTFAASHGANGVELEVEYLGSNPEIASGMDPDNPFHRRDLNVLPALAPNGDARIGVYGGVFKGGRMEGYEEPIYISADSLQPLGLAIQVDTATEQLLNPYDCGGLQLYSASRQIMYSTFFGGMSYYYWDESCACLKHDPVDMSRGIDGLPFIDSITTLRVAAEGSAQYLHRGASFPPAGAVPECPSTDGAAAAAHYLGSETKFVIAPGVPTSANGVILLDELPRETVIGYLVGGIAATAPYSSAGVTCASRLIYQVTLDPGQPTNTVALRTPESGEAAAAR